MLAEESGLSRSKAAVLARVGGVLVNGRPAKANHILYPGDDVRYTLPEPVPIGLVPEDIPLCIVYEDQDVLVVDKPRGMVVHPAAGNWSGTMVNALLWHLGGDCEMDASGVRPGIVHRLDKDTSGLLVVAKNDKALAMLHSQLHERTATREYLAIAIGVPRQQSGTVDMPIARHKLHRKKMAVCEGGRVAITHYEVERRLRGHSLLRLRLETGRTHQIRVHMAAIGHPLLGDDVYGGKPRTPLALKVQGQLLHARLLGFSHPITGARMSFETEPPQIFQDVLGVLEQG